MSGYKLTITDVRYGELGEVPGLDAVCQIDDVGGDSGLPGTHEGTSNGSVDSGL